MADLFELAEDNPFRIRALRRAAEIIADFPEDMGQMDEKAQLAIPGIGKGVTGMLREFKNTGHVLDHEKLKKKFPAGVLAVMNLQGLGAKRAGVLYKKLKIDSLQKLGHAAKSGKLLKISGFGEKMQQAILENIAFAEESSKRILISTAYLVSSEIKTYLSQSPSINQLTLAGSARRWKETIGDLDFLCTSENPEKALAHFIKYPGTKRILANGNTKASIVIENGLQVDFRVVDRSCFGATLLYFTGSKQHNVRLREWAQKKGLTLNEYGLFKLNDTKRKNPVAAATEEEIYKKLGMQWIPPELREDRGEVEAALKNKIPNLISEKDIQGDFHNHTNMSDGADSIEEMAKAAEAMGWSWYYCGDHSPSLTIANGLSPARLKAKLKTIQKINALNKKFPVYCSSEVDILSDGKMDYPDNVLQDLGAVVASVHSRFKQTQDEMTERICQALKNPHVDILGHISGRLINRRKGYELDYDAILEQARLTQTAIEINGQPERQELSDIHVKKAIEMGIPMVVSTDAHSTEQLKHIKMAVHIARRGWAEAKHILNTRPIKEISEWLKN